MAVKTTLQLRRDTLSAWQTKNPVLASGEVALVDKNNGQGAKLWVIRIGDGVHNFNDLPETAYALRSEVESLGEDVLSSAKAYTDVVSAAMNAAKQNKITATGVLSCDGNGNVAQADMSTYAKLGDNVSFNSITITEGLTASGSNSIEGYATTADLTSTSQALSSEISAKVKIEGTPVPYINISRVDAATYHGIINGGTIPENTVYVVSSDSINAFGEKVINVGDATNLSDAVNLKLLNAAKDELTTTISVVSSAIDNRLTSVESSVGDHAGSISQLFGSVSDLGSRLDTAEDDITSLTTQVNSLESELTSYAVSISALGRTGDTFKYQITQGVTDVGLIEVPYDVFVDGGEVKRIDDKTYLLLTLNNDASSVLSIEATDLVDIYTPENAALADGGTVDVSISNYKVSAGVIDGSITAAKLSSDSVTTAKIVDGAVTNAKIAANAVGTAQLSAEAVTPAKMSTTETFVFDCGGANG